MAMLFYRNIERITITLKGDSCKIMLSLQFYATVNVIVIVFLTLRKLSIKIWIDYQSNSMHGMRAWPSINNSITL